MKRNLLLTLLMLLPLWASAQQPHSERRARKQAEVAGCAELELTQFEYDFGVVDRRGGDLSYHLTLRNVGTAPLVLTRVITSCSCLKSNFSKRPIPAGAEAQIELIYQPLKAEPGTFNKVVQILSNSASGRALFSIRGTSIDHKRKKDE